MTRRIDLDVFHSLLPHGKTIVYPKGDRVLRCGETGDRLGCLLSGKLEIVHPGNCKRDEKDLIVRTLYPDDLYGTVGVFTGLFVARVDIVAAERSKAFEIDYSRISELIRRDPAWGVSFLKFVGIDLANRLTEANTHAYSLAYHSVYDRIERILWEMARHPSALTHPMGYQIRITRYELAKKAGCSREMAGRILKTMHEKGVIHLPKQSGKTVIVIDRRKRV